MKYIKFIIAVGCVTSACIKENGLPRLPFSAQDRAWFIYQVGQKFEFKNSSGDSITFIVDSLKDYFSTEYNDPFGNPVAVDNVETYIAHLQANDDFINFAFYKSSIFGSDAKKLNQSIAWHNVAGQFVNLENIEDQTPFISKTVGGITYNRVTLAIPLSDVKYPWTKWSYGYYDQKSGFIELIDTSGASWLRQ